MFPSSKIFKLIKKQLTYFDWKESNGAILGRYTHDAKAISAPLDYNEMYTVVLNLHTSRAAWAKGLYFWNKGFDIDVLHRTLSHEFQVEQIGDAEIFPTPLFSMHLLPYIQKHMPLEKMPNWVSGDIDFSNSYDENNFFNSVELFEEFLTAMQKVFENDLDQIMDDHKTENLYHYIYNITLQGKRLKGKYPALTLRDRDFYVPLLIAGGADTGYLRECLCRPRLSEWHNCSRLVGNPDSPPSKYLLEILDNPSIIRDKYTFEPSKEGFAHMPSEDELGPDMWDTPPEAEPS